MVKYQGPIINNQTGFSKIWLVLGSVVVLILIGLGIWLINPAERLREGRDRQRITDLTALQKAIDFYLQNNADRPLLCDSCPSPTVFAAKTLSVGSTSVEVRDSIAVGGTGWVPVDFSLNADFGETPLRVLPIDPTDMDPYVYTFTAGSAGKFKLTAKLEAAANQSKMTDDGGIDNDRYEVGTDLTLPP